jgi:hypothetical protein
MNTQAVQQPRSTAPSTFVPGRGLLLQRKCACGGNAGKTGECEECRNKKRLQAKLAIGASNDPLEQEADRIADQVLAAPVHPAAGGAAARLRRYTRQPAGETATAPASVDHTLADSGRPLEPALRHDMEQRFGHDFSRVRVHADAAAEQSVRDVDANAYTVGNRIVFGAGRFAPGLIDGKKLIAHELTHALQQSGHTAGLVQRSPDEKKKPDEKPTAKFVGCDKDRLPVVQDAIKKAEALASRALQAFEREYPFTNEIAAMKTHFGSLANDQKATIIERYKHVLSNLGSKSYACSKANKKVKEGDEVVDICGQAMCPGNNITLFPDFGKETRPAGPVMLHEAVHNAGGCDDINKGNSYPPSSSEDNAYSYEYFALDVTAGYKTRELGKRKPTVPKVKD